MANTHRYLYGDQDIIYLTPSGSNAIEIGDFVVLQNDLLEPVSAVADAGDAAANREAGADVCVGIAMAASGSGETSPIPVATAGVFKLTQQTAAAIHQGDAVEIYADADGCSDQLIVEGSTSPVAVCVDTHTDATTTTACKLLPSKIFGTLNT